MRYLAFNAVGAGGFLLQLICLWLLKEALGLHYLMATALAVELALLHNFCWHVRWTWADRPASAGQIGRRLMRFNLTNGAVSVLGNLALMTAFVEIGHLHFLPANVLSVLCCSLVNYALSDLVVFR